MSESQLWRQHPNLFLRANPDDLTPKGFYYSGFISELQRFVWDIGNLWNLIIVGVLQFPIGFALQVTWTVECYEPTSSPEKVCRWSVFIWKIWVTRAGVIPLWESVFGFYLFATSNYLNEIAKTWSYLTYWPSQGVQELACTAVPAPAVKMHPLCSPRYARKMPDSALRLLKVWAWSATLS